MTDHERHKEIHAALVVFEALWPSPTWRNTRRARSKAFGPHLLASPARYPMERDIWRAECLDCSRYVQFFDSDEWDGPFRRQRDPRHVLGGLAGEVHGCDRSNIPAILGVNQGRSELQFQRWGRRGLFDLNNLRARIRERDRQRAMR